MLTILVVAGIIGFLFVVPSPEKKTAPVVEHHHHVTVVRPVYVDARVLLIQAEIRLHEAKLVTPAVEVPEARALTRQTRALDAYRRNDKPS